MGCNSSRARDAAAADAARLETLKTPKLSRRLSKGAAFFAGGAVSPSVSKDDDQLEKLNLPLNGDILEDELITEEEQAFLRDEIEPRRGSAISSRRSTRRRRRGSASRGRDDSRERSTGNPMKTSP